MNFKFQEIRELVKKYPNDMELGAEVRKIFYNLDASFNREEFTGKKIYESPDDRGTTAKDLEATQQELAEIKRISANAIQLDRLTNELTSKLEDANARNDLLKLQNARLEDRVESREFRNGIAAVLLGIIIAVVIPRLTVKRRRNDGWR